MEKLLYSVILGFLLITTLIYQFLTYIKYKTLFDPVKNQIWQPEIKHENLFLESGHEKIHAWRFDMFPGNPIILFCHGNSGNISHRDYMVEFCKMAELNLMLFDYSGFGSSTGKPTLTQVERDGLTAYDHVSEHYPPEKIICWGESLGSYVATTIASNRECGYLLLMATFSSFQHILSNKDYPSWIKNSLAFAIHMLTETQPSYIKIQKVKCPIAIVHSEDDELIPFRCAEILYEHTPDVKKKFIKIKGGHATPIMKVNELEELLRFCNFKVKNPLRFENWLDRLSKLGSEHHARS